jgi:hypothetical protein
LTCLWVWAKIFFEIGVDFFGEWTIIYCDELNIQEIYMKQPEIIMEIAFDEDKVKRIGEYDVDSMYAIVDDYFAKVGQIKLAKGKYGITGKNDDYSNQVLFYATYSRTPWFLKYAKTWNWLELDDDIPGKYWTEDILKQVREKRMARA